MIAVYRSGIDGLSVVKVKDNHYDSFMDAIEKENLAYPSSDIVFIENDKVICRRASGGKYIR